MYQYQAIISRIVDADTLVLVIDLGFDISKKEVVRLNGINAPERFTDEGKAATSFVANLIEQLGSNVLVCTQKKGKYGRYIGDIIFQVDGGNDLNLSEHLVASGHAVKVNY